METLTKVTLDAQFEEFHKNNPDVYRELVRLARMMKARGHKRIGIKMLWEVLRWERAMKTTDQTEWKLNNNYTSRYARLIMENEPDLKGFFVTRGLG